MTNAPTRELRQHHDVEAPRVDERAFRQGWIIRTRLDQLLNDERITRGEYQSATEFRAAWISARELRGPEGGMIRVAGARDRDAATIARLEAARRVRVVEHSLGRLAFALVTACVIEDLSWASIAKYCHRNPETIRDWTVSAIRGLARAWAVATGRQDADPPVRRRGRPRAA